MKIQLTSGQLINSEANSTNQTDKRALLVYAGTFESMDGPVEITPVHLELLVRNHNERLTKLGDFVRMGDYPPIQLDHSTSAKDTVGRLVGPLEIGIHDGVPALFGQVRILGAENWERVSDGRWTHLSIGADLEKGELQELTITPFPAAKNAKLLSQKGANMNKLLKRLMEKNGITEDEAKEKLSAMTDEEKTALGDEVITIQHDGDGDGQVPPAGEGEGENKEDNKTDLSKSGEQETFEHRGQDCKIMWSSLKGDGTDTQYWGSCPDLNIRTKPARSVGEAKAAVKTEVEKNEREATQMSTEEPKEPKDDEKEESKAQLSAAIKQFATQSTKVRLQLRAAQITAKLSRLKAQAKITPAEVKKMDVAKLSASSEETVNAVLASYEAREPVIIPGQYGTLKAVDASHIASKIHLSQLEAETRNNMSLLKKTAQPGVKLSSMDNTAQTDNNTVDETTLSTDSDTSWSEIVKAMQAGDEEGAKKIFMANCRASSGETAVDETAIATLMSAFAALEDNVGTVVKLAGGITGIKL